MTDRPQSGVGARPVGGRLAEMVAEATAPSFRQSFPAATCAKVAVLAGLLVWLNFWQFRDYLIPKWIDDTNWSHGFLIPLFSLYLLYGSRADLLAARRRVCLGGLGVLILGILMVLVGVYPLQNPYTSHLGLIVMLLGLVLYLGGPRVIRVTWLPIAFLIFAMPLPDTQYSKIALPLQNLAAAASELVLKVFGVKITSSHSALFMTSVSGITRNVQVAEACSGMRLLVAFLALGVAMAWLDEKPIWQRVVLVVMGAPIAILCNVLRVVITCAMHVHDRPELGESFMHEFTGMLMLIPALLMLGGLSWLLRRLVVEEEDEGNGEDGAEHPAGAGAEAKAGAPKRGSMRLGTPSASAGGFRLDWPAARAWCRAERHFLAAAILLGTTAAGWNLAVSALRIYTRKLPVPWPEGVQVGEDFRCLSLPTQLGPYELAGDGELEQDKEGRPKLDGRPDGEVIFRSDLMETLKIGTSTDKANLPRRCSNWYFSRIYVNRGLPAGHPMRLWHLDIQYYTGGVDAVPHVPDICLQASGARLVSTQEVTIHVPQAPAPWDAELTFRRAVYQPGGLDEARPITFAQYYTFSLNGNPESTREVVRLKLTNPFVRYAYFAKIQFSPRQAIRDLGEADEAARHFARFSLPQILKALALPYDVRRLEGPSAPAVRQGAGVGHRNKAWPSGES